MSVSDTTAPAPFVFESEAMGNADFRVVSFSGHERISALYEFRIRVLSSLSWKEIYGSLLRDRARLSIRRFDGGVRTVTGVISEVDARGRRPDTLDCEYEIRLVPRMWLLGQRYASRIFQDMSVREIVETVLKSRMVPFRWTAAHDYPVRAYCVQYEESDLAFVERILAQHGVFYFFEEACSAPGTSKPDTFGESGEVLVLADHPTHYVPFSENASPPAACAGTVATPSKVLPSRKASRDVDLPAAAAIALRGDDARIHEECIFRFRMSRRIRPSKVELRDYEYMRPQYDRRTQHASKPSDTGHGGPPSSVPNQK